MCVCVPGAEHTLQGSRGLRVSAAWLLELLNSLQLSSCQTSKSIRAEYVRGATGQNTLLLGVIVQNGWKETDKPMDKLPNVQLRHVQSALCTASTDVKKQFDAVCQAPKTRVLSFRIKDAPCQRQKQLA